MHEVTVTFWTYSPHGPQPSWRTIAVPEWDEIEANYAHDTRSKLAHMMRDFEPAHGGQLILWHGSAGTGKTFGLRALAWEWRDWCDFHYIVDPDSFFGEHADYLMSVLLMPAYDTPRHAIVPFPGAVVRFGNGEGEEERPEKPWRVLILEDTGELLTPDAKTMIGQGLSRFLNVVDGLIGQDACARARDHERTDPHAPPRRREAGAVRGQHRVRTSLGRRGERVAGASRA